jgi:hypothetical protein
LYDVEHPRLSQAHLKILARDIMRMPKWIVVAQTSAKGTQDARDEERWLKLGDEALANRKSSDEQKHYNLLAPGSRAKQQLNQVARELQDRLRKYLKRMPQA